MKIIIAPDSFKGSLSALEVADAIERGIKKMNSKANVIKVPMADGGEGTVQSLVDATKGKIIEIEANDPLMRKVKSFYGILGDGKTAAIEMAAVSGLPLISEEERNPLKTTTYGTGELIKDALDMGCRNFVIGIGGSATNDGGAGMAQALGAKLLDKDGNEIGLGGDNLAKLAKIDLSCLDSRIEESKIEVACDVDNPLCGSKGASLVYGYQKGGDKEIVEHLDECLLHYANIIKKDLGIDIKDIPGSGAAGGLGGGLIAFLNGQLKKGVDIVIETTEIEDKIKDADLVITGEGMIDYQTFYGKTPYGVAKVANKYKIPVIAIAGSIGKDAETLYSKGFNSIFSIIDKPMKLEDAMENTNLLLEKTAERILRAVSIFIK